MKSSATSWSIGDTATRFGLPAHVLRHWEEVGLLRPGRDGGGRRRYGENDVVRIAAVLRNKAAGMSLEQIRVLLDQGAPDRHAILTEHVADLDRRMAEMQRSREMTMHAFECDQHDMTTCPNFVRSVEDLIGGGPWRSQPPPPA
ncbi:transcriptional regulator, MerR family [Aeromicrobium marinum DSM 15272]|uniref:Transcriptional regulator, MerR family n=1 Tax=Aeromicrobium marinum DSM 15272 TaxID=585531 RepID=E2SB35_9ACTN|nr:MerR family transcriptional regulator [Aeromicrobium marinum]EFQ83581.1 transcriptional regulator, MerR family [Aeromicrobium marinum DSM 15272]